MGSEGSITGIEPPMVSLLLNSQVVRIDASSVLNDDENSYGGQFVLDGQEDTCWNSESGLPQSLNVQFKNDVQVDRIGLMFQGGFAGSAVELWVGSEKRLTLYPCDHNELQEFPVSLNVDTTQELILKFVQSTDFYGRITVYMLNIYGSSRE